MMAICPICGNEIYVNVRANKDFGFCTFCRRDYQIIRQKRKGKIKVSLIEKENNSNLKQF